MLRRNLKCKTLDHINSSVSSSNFLFWIGHWDSLCGSFDVSGKHIPEKHFKGETVVFHAFLWFVGGDDYGDAGDGDKCNDVGGHDVGGDDEHGYAVRQRLAANNLPRGR